MESCTLESHTEEFIYLLKKEPFYFILECSKFTMF